MKYKSQNTLIDYGIKKDYFRIGDLKYNKKEQRFKLKEKESDLEKLSFLEIIDCKTESCPDKMYLIYQNDKQKWAMYECFSCNRTWLEDYK